MIRRDLLWTADSREKEWETVSHLKRAEGTSDVRSGRRVSGDKSFYNIGTGIGIDIGIAIGRHEQTWLFVALSSATYVNLVISGRITSMPSAGETSSSGRITYGDYVVATSCSRVFIEDASVLVLV